MFSQAIDEQTRVKVAILDTGIDTGHHLIQARKERIKDVRTWVGGLGGKEDRRAGDSSGHGTHIANLLLDMAPDTDIYIARIAKFNPIEPSEIAKVRSRSPSVLAGIVVTNVSRPSIMQQTFGRSTSFRCPLASLKRMSISWRP